MHDRMNANNYYYLPRAGRLLTLSRESLGDSRR